MTKPSAGEAITFPAGDYVAPGFSCIRPDAYFPFMAIGDRSACRWPHLRRDVPHNWYVDRRIPDVGFVNRDEAHILYNTALRFRDRLGLEIGCWFGWSACHLALGGLRLDVIDPELANPDIFGSVIGSLTAAGVDGRVTLIPGISPRKVIEIASLLRRRWSFIFIDGAHDAPGPQNDAKAAHLLASDDALVLFHDLASPDVTEGLAYLRERGWRTLIYQTMQIMGVAWRGAVEPVVHIPDPAVKWVLPPHLASFEVSGSDARSSPPYR